jgi:hypothetical protein
MPPTTSLSSPTRLLLALSAMLWTRAPTRRRVCVGLCCMAIGLATIGFVSRPTARADDLKNAGTVDIEQTQIAFIGSGNLGGGTLYFGGKTYSFTVGGLGIGGFGISTMKATGTVYNLSDINQFPGAYVQGRYGFAAGTTGSGEMWLKNTNGVVINLKTEREGLALSLGGDAVYIGWN